MNDENTRLDDCHLYDTQLNEGMDRSVKKYRSVNKCVPKDLFFVELAPWLPEYILWMVFNY